MTARASALPATDMAGIGVSSLCLVHCLALPLASAALPLAGALAEAEAIHRALVVLAGVLVAFATAQSWARPGVIRFAGVASVGLVFLALGAFVEPLHDHETALTVIGALVLALAHILRWRGHRRV